MLFKSIFLMVMVILSVKSEEIIALGTRLPHDRYLGAVSISRTKTETPMDTYKIMNAGEVTSTISEMRIIEKANGCATAVPINGGPGSNFVVLHFIAPPNCDVDYTVELYGV